MADFTEPQSVPLDSVIPPIQKFNEFSSGAGATTFKANKEGVFAGAPNFVDAPWKLDYTGINTVGPNGEIIIDGPNGTITAGTNTDIVIDGPNGTITTDKIKDKTYGLYGVFVKTLKIVSGGGNTTSTIVTNNGGLLSVTVNYTTGGDAVFKLLPSFNVSTFTSYYNVDKSGGNYRLNLYRGNIEADVAGINYYYITALFNSLETSGW